MEKDLRLRRDFHSPSFPELNRSDFYSDSSATTVHNTSVEASPFQSRRWTDQLHKLYLSSLEASFVNELHRSIHLRGCGWSFHNNDDETYKCRTLQNTSNMPRQSLALQDGCQKKISLETIAPVLESTADSHVLAGREPGRAMLDKACSLREPCTYDHGLPFDEEIHASGSSSFANKSARSCLEKQCSFHGESGCSTTEVADQNFKDEVASSSSMPVAKRLKTVAADRSSTDQIVPFGKFQTTDVSTISNSTQENEGHDLLFQLPESLHASKSDPPHFLRDR
ncbi:cold-regulated protein 27-like isoform X2 [Vicia villosa]|uniref:cold-regulated protein 27-like isoform X2 n=1 Tax=Vicia villosa TaxID=3911 RepID=UPI00273C1713|nr:cold-regulated protein 27-like isoform X2 [Vicia villosa]